MTAALGAHVAGDHARVAAHRVAVDGVIDAAVADAGFLHSAHDLLESLGIVRAQTVQLDVADVAAVGQFVIRRFQRDLIEHADLVIDGHVE